MRLSSILRLASCAVLLGSMSSFSGCEKDNVHPNGGSCTKKTTATTTTTTPADTTKTTGAN